MTVIPDKIYLRPESTIFYIITIVKEKINKFLDVF